MSYLSGPQIGAHERAPADRYRCSCGEGSAWASELPPNSKSLRRVGRAIRGQNRRNTNTGGYHFFTMSHSSEPAAEEPPQSAGKRRPAHSGGESAHSVQQILSRWATLAAALIAIIALGVAIWALLRPPADNLPSPTPQQIADAKGRACSAYGTVRTAVALQTRVEPAPDPVAAQAVAANARLAMAVGGDYLLGHLDPAVPPQLAELLRSLAADLQDLTINALAGVGDTDPGQVARLHDVEAKSAKIVDLCK